VQVFPSPKWRRTFLPLAPKCLCADAAVALGKWMKQALAVDDPTLFLRLKLSEHGPAYALSDLKLFADFFERSGGFCIEGCIAITPWLVVRARAR
jgi:hypothetical protein